MAKKRLHIKDKNGNAVDYDIAASSVTVGSGNDAAPLDEVLSEIGSSHITYDSNTTTLVIDD